MANAWHRVGTVTVTNGSPLVVGANTSFSASGINIGDLFVGPDGGQYEVTLVWSDTQISVKSDSGIPSYVGPSMSSQPYAIIKTGPNNALLANQLSTLAAGWLADRQQYAAWQGGLWNGGPNSDGKYPLTDANGVTTYVLCPAAVARSASLVGEASNSSEEADLFNQGYRFVIRTDLIAGYVPPTVGTTSVTTTTSAATTTTTTTTINPAPAASIQFSDFANEPAVSTIEFSNFDVY